MEQHHSYWKHMEWFEKCGRFSYPEVLQGDTLLSLQGGEIPGR